MPLVFWPLTFKISEVDEPCACEYASASQCFQPLAGEEIYGRISETEFWKTWLVCDHVSLNCYFLIQQFVAIEIYRRRGLTVFCRDLNITADLQAKLSAANSAVIRVVRGVYVSAGPQTVANTSGKNSSVEVYLLHFREDGKTIRNVSSPWCSTMSVVEIRIIE